MLTLIINLYYVIYGLEIFPSQSQSSGIDNTMTHMGKLLLFYSLLNLNASDLISQFFVDITVFVSLSTTKPPNYCSDGLLFKQINQHPTS